jgi:hypothetical protein
VRQLDDALRGNASVLTKGMNPTDRLAGDASATLTGRHPLIGELPRQPTIKRSARHPGSKMAAREAGEFSKC